MADDLNKALFFLATATAIDNRGKPAVLGKVDGTLYFTDDSGTMHRDRVWARVGEGDSRQESVVYLGKVSPQYGLPVRVDNVNGVTQVIDTDGRLATIFGGGLPPSVFSVSAHAVTHGRLGPDPLYVTGLQVLPLLVHPTNPAGMTVTVEQGSYRWQGADEIFETADSADLTSYVPGTSTVKHFIIIVLDRSAGALVVVDGDDISASGDDVLFGTGELTAADVQAVLDTDMLPEYWPLAAILLYNGQTAIRAKDIVFDLRPWGGEGDAASGTYVEKAGDTMAGALVVGNVAADSNDVMLRVSGRTFIQRDNAANVGSFVNYNKNTTDGTGITFGFNSDTTGAGASAEVSFAQITGRFITHDHATRDGGIQFRTARSGTQATRLNIGLGVAINNGDTEAATSAALEIGGTDGAFLPPRLTTTQRDALTPAAGMLVFNVTTSKFQGYDGTSWVDLH